MRLVDVVGQLARRIPDVRLTIVGDGSLQEDLRSRVEHLGLEESVRLVGQHPDVKRFLQSSDIFVLLSESEGMPISMLEAMACGLPVVVTRVGDIEDLVQDEIHGCLIDRSVKDPELVDRIYGLLTMPEQRFEMISARVRNDAMRLAAIGEVVGRWRDISSTDDGEDLE
jgi:glycosyltransferase involved in cell wall biosynthesis